MTLCSHKKGAGHIQIFWVDATKKDNFKTHDFCFSFYYIGISVITILETIIGWRLQLPS